MSHVIFLNNTYNFDLKLETDCREIFSNKKA